MRIGALLFLLLFTKTTISVFSNLTFLNQKKNKFKKQVNLCYSFVVILAACLSVLPIRPCFAKDGESLNTEDWSFHFQTTGIAQGDAPFRSPYAGKNSLNSKGEIKETVSATLFLGRKLWEGAGLYVNPELTQGTGLSDTLGIAGFPNGEATRVGNIKTSLFERAFMWNNFARAFIRQAFNLGGELKCIESGQNQLACEQTVSNLTITAGKFSATDIFDKNSYANDPRTQFLNWTLMANGAWDYPAGGKGYTLGATVELNKEDWAIRAGDFLVPRVANTSDMNYDFWKAFGLVGEAEKRYKILNREGAIRVLGFITRAHMGNYEEAIDSPVVDITKSEKYRYKFGSGINLEQALTDDLGGFHASRLE